MSWLTSCAIIAHFLFYQFTFSATIKRSPLETGFVTSLSDDNNQHGHHTLYHHTILAKDTTAAFPATLLLQKPDSANVDNIHSSASLRPNLDVPAPQSPQKRRIVVWLPGRVYHHAYIPPHQERHLTVPTASIFDEVIHPELRSRGQQLNSISYHGLDHYGGFGVGIATGGQGAGHGWEVVGMLYNSF